MLGIFSLAEKHVARLFVLVFNFKLNPESGFHGVFQSSNFNAFGRTIKPEK
jgi:hypothetical protein